MILCSSTACRCILQQRDVKSCVVLLVFCRGHRSYRACMTDGVAMVAFGESRQVSRFNGLPAGRHFFFFLSVNGNV